MHTLPVLNHWTWIVLQTKKLKGVSLQRAKNGLTKPEFKCPSFERALWFHFLHKTMWTKSRNIFYEQDRYLSQHISKPFKWNMVKYCERVSSTSPLTHWRVMSTRKLIGKVLKRFQLKASFSIYSRWFTTHNARRVRSEGKWLLSHASRRILLYTGWYWASQHPPKAGEGIGLSDREGYASQPTRCSW